MIYGRSQGFFSSTTFFFYTAEQVKQYSNNGSLNIFNEAYFNLIKPYDEFDYIKKEASLLILIVKRISTRISKVIGTTITNRYLVYISSG